ncbi:hypothetical protein IFO69_18915 [Echinicola sp. CAU 1574]|uniref:Uncharacterized protein n=1 Tax=Echinicola arenosa TaxID=2774144 RepID=A0ABR9APW4_9BACT|nr:hypothetical protein [Echinicola arenosa]MBD8490831.1 hypothetical protein [Echinicola arenosa]
MRQSQIASEEAMIFNNQIGGERGVLDFMPLMEKEFERVERIVGKELTREAAYHYYDFYEMAHAIKSQLKTINVFCFRERKFSEDKISQGETYFRKLDRKSLWNILLDIIDIDQINHGFFEKKIKDKTVLKILKAYKDSFR